MLKRIVCLGLLCVAVQAHANITVTTTADIENYTSACTLRDAIKLVNTGDTTKQMGGCIGSDASTTIVLAAATTYKLNSRLPKILKTITLQSTSFGDISSPDGSRNALIVAGGKFRIFDNTSDAPNVAITLTINSIDLKGCGTGAAGSAICDTNGGVIYNAGTLNLTNVRIYNGSATNGGGIYNTGPGKIGASTIELKNNNAEEQGAALWSQNASFVLSQSLIRDNTINAANASTGFAIYTLNIDDKLTSTQSGLRASTVYNNTANAMNIVPGILVTNATIVGNHGGVTLNSPSLSAGLFNSIVGDNNGADCTFIAGDKTPVGNLVFTNSCASGSSGLPDGSKQLSDTGTETLMATGTSVNGRVACALSPAVGILCPFSIAADQFNGFLLPRLLYPQYKTISESPIVNKGYSGTSSIGTCTSADQRGKERTLCDIGAIELVIPSGNSQLNGQDISFGQTATLDLTTVIGDGQLIPASACPSIYPSITPSQGGVWLDGCLVYTSAPTKGSVLSLDASTNLMLYKSSSDFHGYDQFSYNIISSTSFFSTAKNDQTINVTTTINQSQPAGISSKTVGAGGVGIFAVLGLVGLASRRRLTGGQL